MNLKNKQKKYKENIVINMIENFDSILFGFSFQLI